MLAIIITAFITFFVTSLFGYVVHRSLHQSWTGKLNQSHMTHHLVLYPPSDYLSAEYRNAGKDNTLITFAILSVPLVGLPILLGLVGLLPLSLVITVLIMMGIMGYLHNYIHDAFHIRNHWLNNFSIFRTWNDLHYWHHVDMQKNFGIFLFHWDHIFRTYVKSK